MTKIPTQNLLERIIGLRKLIAIVISADIPLWFHIKMEQQKKPPKNPEPIIFQLHRLTRLRNFFKTHNITSQINVVFVLIKKINWKKDGNHLISTFFTRKHRKSVISYFTRTQWNHRKK